MGTMILKYEISNSLKNKGYEVKNPMVAYVPGIPMKLEVIDGDQKYEITIKENN